MHIELRPSTLKGQVTAPPSKSMAHRAVICAALAELQTGRKAEITNLMLSEDIKATLHTMKQIQEHAGADSDPVELFCNESGSTLRFLIPIAAAMGGAYCFTGAGRLVERPINAYTELFEPQGIQCHSQGGRLPYHISGKLKSGRFPIRGDVSSQYISGLLFALPLLEGDSIIEITTLLESESYVELTLEMLRRFGIQIEKTQKEQGLICYHVKGKQTYQPVDCVVEGDYSQAAFWEAAKLFGMDIQLDGLSSHSLQGDRQILQIVDLFRARKADETSKIDAAQIPDLVPIITVMASVCPGSTEIINAARLRIKESDRLAATAQIVNALGGQVEEHEDRLFIQGMPEGLTGGVSIQSYNDHRLAMAVAMAVLKCKEPVQLEGAECVRKSYPDFWDVYRSVGGYANELDLGR